jgi:hypothetical protein
MKHSNFKNIKKQLNAINNKLKNDKEQVGHDAQVIKNLKIQVFRL